MEPEAPNRLKELRYAAGMSLEVLAQRSGVSKNSINLIEKGEQELNLDKMRRLGSALNVAPSALLNEADVEFRPSPELQPILETLKSVPADNRVDLARAATALVGLARTFAARTSGANLDGHPEMVRSLADLWNAMSDAERERSLRILSAGGFADGQRRYLSAG